MKIQSKKEVKKNNKREAESCTLDPSSYVVNVTPSSLRYDMLVSTPNLNQKLSLKGLISIKNHFLFSIFQRVLQGQMV